MNWQLKLFNLLRNMCSLHLGRMQSKLQIKDCSRHTSCLQIMYYREVLTWLRNTSERLTNAAISESASSNMIQRLIKIIREEFSAKKQV